MMRLFPAWVVAVMGVCVARANHNNKGVGKLVNHLGVAGGAKGRADAVARS